ncbi:hypothetical protein [Pseudorhodobacter sp.]|uniref:hypothetical protein n=1 Tax=Pseudorhodobacter sp. TaxID=1934400 RepID=UPI0026480F23|nr:hypothetical protein [Pseudorhodobacter sp.]MDN5787627.1 hypothetical protein [Pseudorhodobacter sp.]
MAKNETVADRQSGNFKVFSEWLKQSGGMILPIPNRGAIYAGVGKINLMRMQRGFQAEPEAIPMWKIIQKAEKDAREYEGYVTIDTINDVLRRIKSPLPKLIEATGANAGHPKRYSDMLSCVEALASDSWELLSKPDRRNVWSLVSEKYAENLRGDVQIWEGVSKRLRLLEPYKVMLQTELKKIQGNPRVSAASRKNVEDLIKKYEKHYGELGRSAKSNDAKFKASYKRAMQK